MLKNECIQSEISKKILGRGTAPPQTHPNWEGGHPLPRVHPFGAEKRGAKCASHSTPLKSNPVSAPCSHMASAFSCLSVDCVVRHTTERAICLEHIADVKLFCNKHTLALYVHCGAPCINLIAQTSCESVPFVRDALAV